MALKRRPPGEELPRAKEPEPPGPPWVAGCAHGARGAPGQQSRPSGMSWERFYTEEERRTDKDRVMVNGLDWPEEPLAREMLLTSPDYHRHNLQLIGFACEKRNVSPGPAEGDPTTKATTSWGGPGRFVEVELSELAHTCLSQWLEILAESYGGKYTKVRVWRREPRRRELALWLVLVLWDNDEELPNMFRFSQWASRVWTQLAGVATGKGKYRHGMYAWWVERTGRNSKAPGFEDVPWPDHPGPTLAERWRKRQAGPPAE